jgi:SpoIVB peptidase S55
MIVEASHYQGCHSSSAGAYMAFSNRLNHRIGGFILTICLLLTTVAFSDGFITPQELKPGMKGVGRSVFKGTKIEEFSVEVIGVHWNSDVRSHMIMVRCSGANLEHSGVVAGMSGSPIYFDGRLAGALAYAWSFGKDPIAGVTPIGDMLEVMNMDMSKKPWRRPAPRAVSGKGVSTQSWGDKVKVPFRSLDQKVEADTFTTQVPDYSQMIPLRSPLFISGCSGRVVEEFRSELQDMGWQPIAMPSVGRPNGPVEKVELEPGGAVSVALITGDIDIGGYGTLTYRDGDRFVAFGHPMDQSGSSDLPIGTAHVLHIMSMVDRSFKVAYTLETVGSMRQDRLPAIGGLIGPVPDMLPLSVDLLDTDTGKVDRFNFEVTRAPSYTGSMVMMAIFSCLDRRSRSYGSYNVRFAFDMELEGFEDLSFSDFFSGQGSPFGVIRNLTTAIANMLTNPYEEVGIKNIKVRIELGEKMKTASVTAVRLQRPSVRPGDALRIWYELSQFDAETQWKSHTLNLPASLPVGRYQLQVVDGSTAMMRERMRAPGKYVADSAGKMLTLMRQNIPNNSLNFVVISMEKGATVEGKELPDLPSSVLWAHTNTPETGGPRMIRGAKVFSDQTTMDFSLTGNHTLFFTIDRNASPVED